MPDTPLRILLIEDNPADADLIVEALEDAPDEPPFELVTEPRLESGLRRLAAGDVTAVLLDLSLPDSQGLDTFTRVRAEAPAVPVVVLSGLVDQDLAARAVREGAQDYLVKGQVEGELLVRSLRYAIERKQAELEREQRIREQAARAEAEDAQRRFAFLAEASRQLADTLDYEATLQSVARLAVPMLADWCIVDVVDDTPRRIAIAHADPARAATAAELQRLGPPDPTGASPTLQALRDGRSQLLTDLTNPFLRAITVDDEHLRLVHELGPVSAMIVPLVARGRVLGVLSFVAAESGRRYDRADLAFAEDLAGRAALAVDNARLYAQLQQQVRTRDEFLAAASHDLKTPLTSIKGTAQLLRRRAARGAIDPAQLMTDLERIDDAVGKIVGLFDDLLDVACLRLGRPLDLDGRPTDLVALARQVAAEHERLSDRHTITIRTTEPAVVGHWDPARLERVIGNILGNAVKYSPNGGDIAVDLRRECTADAEWAVLAVSDPGVGIPERDLPHVFDRFNRASNVIGRISGTGIGLATSRQIIEQHGGTITVESREGLGSTFTIRLPLSPANEPIAAGRP